MKKLTLALALLTTTPAYANFEICEQYAKMIGLVVQKKNEGVSAREQLSSINTIFAEMPAFRDQVLRDTARLYKIDTPLPPKMVEERVLLNCLEGE